MPIQSRKRAAPQAELSRESSGAPSSSVKRRRTANGTVKGEPAAKKESVEIEEVDLRDIDDDSSLSKLLEHQRETTVKAQQDQDGKPLKLSTLQCIICMEPMKNITSTHCGHLFCHTCLMEALIAGEQQGEGGKMNSRCPVCRKRVRRPESGKFDPKDVIPLEIKFMTKKRLDKGKARATELV